MKKLFIVLFVFLQLLIILPVKAEILQADQTCMSPALVGSNLGAYVNRYNAHQVVTPSKNTLDALAVYVKADFAPVEIKAYVANATDAAHAGIIAQMTKQITTAGEQWVLFDFDDAPMPNGIYIISVQVTNPDYFVDWIAADNGCYSGGYAVVGSGARMEHDFGFAIYAYDSQVADPEPEPDPAPDPNPNPDPDPDPDPNSNLNPAATSEPENTESTNSSSQSAANADENNDKPSDLNQNNTNENPVSSTTSENKKSPPGDTSKVNEQTELGKKLMSDKELQETVAGAIADFNANKSKGIFGLGGILGSILTWKNIAIFFGSIAILVGIFYLFIFLVRRKNAKA